MDDSTRQTIAKIQGTIRKQEDAVRGMKQTINTLLEMEGEPPMYGPADLGGSGQPIGTIKSDTFYGQPLNSSIRKILEMRKAGNSGPATVREIFDALEQGGFQFETKNAENAMRNLRISLTKSTAAFHRLPNGSYGLTEWYPEVKPKRIKEPLNGAEPGDQPGSGEEAAKDDE